jgi:hypothetical protein
MNVVFCFFSAEGARTALNLGGTIFGFYPVRVLPSKTAILPVNPKFLPRVSSISLVSCHDIIILLFHNMLILVVLGLSRRRMTRRKWSCELSIVQT